MYRVVLVLAVIVSVAVLISVNSDKVSANVENWPANGSSVRESAFDSLVDKARAEGSVRVIIGLNLNIEEFGRISDPQRSSQQDLIKQVQGDFLGSYNALRGAGEPVLFDHIPFLAMQADLSSIEMMRHDPRVKTIEEDVADAPHLAQSTSVVNAPGAWGAGYLGNGWSVAVLDTGVDKNHNFLSGRISSEACYSTTSGTTSTSVCPGGASESTAANSGLHCALTTSGCNHGTHVAGIVGGTGASSHGVARAGNIIGMQVFSQFNVASSCGSSPVPCALSYVSDQIRALERVLVLSSTTNIAAVNMSLGGGRYFNTCDAEQPSRKAAIDNLRSVNIATVISSGNSGYWDSIGAPACISSAISVGSTGDGSGGATVDVVSDFSNSASFLTLLAPGQWISSSIPVTGQTNSFSNFSGTSMAAPHVAGAIAVMRQRKPNASVSSIITALQQTGLPVTDFRNQVVKSRINVGAAVASLTVKAPPFDIDGDGKTDVSIFRPTGGSGTSEWWWANSSNGSSGALQFGSATDVIAPGDFTGDGKMDITIFRPGTGSWFVLRSNDFSFFSFPFGAAGDTPVTGDYDGDGKADPAVFRAALGQWFIQRSSDNQVQIVPFGIPGDVPVTADYDGDGKDDIGIYRRSGANGGEWWINRSTAGPIALIFGTATDLAVPGDYTGDGKADIAIFRPSNGTWFVLRSEDLSFFSFPFGAAGDIPSPGDYDGDGRIDAAVFRPSNATWYISGSTSGTQILQFGASGDMPIPSAFVR